MRFSHLFFAFVVLLSLSSSCSTTTAVPSDHEGELVIFGQGGGFAGRETGTAILDNGQVFEMDHLGEFTRIEDIGKAEVEQIFKNIDFLQLKDRPFMQPGNTYHFIEIRKGKEVTRLSWDNVSGNAPEDVMRFYKILQSHVEKGL